MPDACTSTALHDCAFAGSDALRCGVLDGLADARWSNFDELSPPALAHPAAALLTALLISRGPSHGGALCRWIDEAVARGARV